MANLSYIERRKLESFLKIGDGYVLNFSNRTFEEFIFDSTGRRVYGGNYEDCGSSKANHLRCFWKKEPDHVVGKLLKDFADYCSLPGMESLEGAACREIAERLLQSAPIQDADIITALSEREEFERLARSVRDAIEKNEPETGLDRLHTSTVKFARSLCEKHGITPDRDKPLHSIFGEYVKHLKAAGLIETRMTELILRSSISTLEAFNEVRNQRSLAHDNQVLNRNESLLIFNHVTSAIRFVWSLEQSHPEPTPEAEGIPF